MGTPINLIDPTEPGLIARSVLGPSAKCPSGPNLAHLPSYKGYWSKAYRL
jgi:hypothetical protein